MGLWDWLMGTPPQQRDMPKRRAVPAARRTSVFALQVGDVVSYDGTDYEVTNKLTYDDEGFTWFDFLLHDRATDQEFWLGVEDDDGVQLGIYHEIDLPVDVPPVPKAISYEGRNYRRTEHGEADVEVEREDSGRRNAASVEFWEFEAPGERYLTISRWGGEYEAAVGQPIKEYELKVYPKQE